MLRLVIHVIDLTRKQGKEIWVEYLLGMQRYVDKNQVHAGKYE